MPEYPDIVLYIERLEHFIQGKQLQKIRLGSPFLLRSVSPTPSQVEGRTVTGFRRMGKRIVFEFDGGVFAVLHLMIAGRLHWKKAGVTVPRRRGLAAFDFENGSLLWTEEGTKKRASLYLVSGEESLAALDPGGLEVLQCSLQEFKQKLQNENHTLKRSLTDPRVFSGIGNAYSDEILHRARLSPVAQTGKLTHEQVAALHQAVRDVLIEWANRLRAEIGDGFPEKVTAFRPEMAVHGRYGLPCRVCHSTVQRIRYADNETHYCVECQTGGKVLADRGLSRLLKKDWPRSLDQLEELRRAHRNAPDSSPPAP